MVAMVELGRSVRGALLDLLLPARCVACAEAVGSPGQLCARCFAITNFVTDPCCQSCGQALPHDGGPAGPLRCAACRTSLPLWQNARAALQYDAQAARIILPFKHADRTDAARALGHAMAMRGAALVRGADILVPVPLHRGRLFTRRYNQSALLATVIGRLGGRPVLVDALRRVRATGSQRGLSVRQRAAAAAGAFAMTARRAAQVDGARILLIDDVLTTGATANACTAVLLDAGAVQVDLLVAARVPWTDADG